ncbi:uncharacterized protein LOC132319209 [Gavia stellata]|uniref:uncharacterized protein LOC132319209 n=1 Tax=Gavia stellata TaxID=37040 RepID=UPI00289FCA5C|nr:uncharacterized protein LOC132319209 [Gavia stellata]
MVPNPLPPQESRTPGDTPPGSGNPTSPRDPQSPRSPSPSWMELLSGMCLVRPVPSGHLLVTLQRTLGAGQGESRARASSRPRQGRSGGSSVTPMTSDSSQTEPVARSLSPGREVAPAQPRWPHTTAITHPNPPHGGVQHAMPKSGHRRVRHPAPRRPPAQPAAAWQGPSPLQPPTARPDAVMRGSAPPLLVPDCPPRPSPPRRDKGTHTKLQATESCPQAPCSPRGPALSPPEVVPSDIPSRALPKLGPGSPWWPLLQAGSQVSPHPTSPLADQQPSAAETMAKGTSGIGKDMAEPVLLGRVSSTILHEAQTESSGSGHDDGDEPSATGFITFFMGKFGRPGGRESAASAGISAG